jgi:hypothetical protein
VIIWYVLWPFGIFLAHLVYVFFSQLVYFVAIWNILWTFGTHFPVLVYGTKKNLASLISFVQDKTLGSRLARWFVFKPKIPIWVNFGGPQDEKCLYIL